MVGNPQTQFSGIFFQIFVSCLRDLEARILNFAKNLLREMEITAPINCIGKFGWYHWNQSCLKIGKIWFGGPAENIDLLANFLLDNLKKSSIMMTSLFFQERKN